jgi:hypothetical protein
MFVFETKEESLLTKSGSSIKLRTVVFFQLAHVGRAPGAVEAPRVIGTVPAPRGSNLAPGMAVPATSMVRSSMAPTALMRRVMTPSGGGGAGTAVAVSPTGGPLAPEPNFMSRIMGRRQFLDVEYAAYRATYTVEDWKGLTEKEAVDVLHQVFAKLDVAKDLFGNENWQTEVAEQVRARLNEKTIRWGVEIHEINFKDVQFNEMTMKNLFAEPRAEREARIKRIDARTQKEIADMLGLDSDALLRWRYIEAVRELAQNPQARIMLSTNMAGGNSGMPFMQDEQSARANALPSGTMPAFPPPNPATAPPPNFPAETPNPDPNRTV